MHASTFSDTRRGYNIRRAMDQSYLECSPRLQQIRIRNQQAPHEAPASSGTIPCTSVELELEKCTVVFLLGWAEAGQEMNGTGWA